MPRKRKTPAAESSLVCDTNDEPIKSKHVPTTEHQQTPGVMPVNARKVIHINLVYGVVKNAQVNEAFHNKYIKELQSIYDRVGHDAFVLDYRRSIQQLMLCDDSQTYANIGLRFLAKVATSYNTEDTHPLLTYTFDWLLNTVSVSHVIRFRLCQFVNFLLNALSNDAALDDSICDNILKYMFERMKDVSPTVRVQALNAMQRLQMPDNPNDPIVKVYQHHLCSDPSPLVRQTVITSIGRNLHTIPFIIDRLWDVDDKVRRHAYLHMCTYSVKSYKVVQRLQFIEQGLNDHCESVRKVVTNVLLPAWLESYNRDYIQFVSALKLDASEADIKRYRKAARLALSEIFKKQPIEDLIAALPLTSADHDPEMKKCLRLDKLTVDSSLYWLALIEYVAGNEHISDELERIQPEISMFCTYLKRYFDKSNAESLDKWQMLEHHYILLTLCEIIQTFDLSDELGRNNLQVLLCEILAREEFDESIVAKIIVCMERVVPDANTRLSLVADIVKNLLDVQSKPFDLSSMAVQKLLADDSELNFKVSSMKVRIMDLEEHERNCMLQKNYAGAEKLREELNECSEQLILLITHSAGGSLDAVLPQLRRVTNQQTLRCIQMCYFVVMSPNVRALNPNIVHVFKNYIRRQMECQHMFMRNHALKCAISFAMLYEQLAKEVYSELFTQFFKHQNSRIWATAISGMFELIDRYGFEHFDEGTSENDTESDVGTAISSTSTDARHRRKSNTRLLYSTDADGGNDGDYDEQMLLRRRNTDIMLVLDHFLDDCAEPFIQQALIDGYCRLLLRSHISGANYVSRMLLKYFNPMTEPEITQMLGIFFEKLISHQRQECLQEAMFTTLFTVLESPPDSPLQEIQPESIIRFVISSTRPHTCSPGLNVHNTIAMSFLDVMSDNSENKDFMRLLAKSFILLDISDDPVLHRDLLVGLDRILAKNLLESRIESNIKLFKQKLIDANVQSATFSSTANGQLSGIDKNTETIEFDTSQRSETHDLDDGQSNLDDTNGNVQKTATIHTSTRQTLLINGDKEVPAAMPLNQSATSRRLTRSPLTPNHNIDNGANSSEATSTTYGLENSTRSHFLRKSIVRPLISTTRKTRTKSSSVAYATEDVQTNDSSVIDSTPPKAANGRNTGMPTSRATRSCTAAKQHPSKRAPLRSKRRNDMIAKSPSPRTMLTVSKQNRKKSRLGSPEQSAKQPNTEQRGRTSMPNDFNCMPPLHTVRSVVTNDNNGIKTVAHTRRSLRISLADTTTTNVLNNNTFESAMCPQTGIKSTKVSPAKLKHHPIVQHRAIAIRSSLPVRSKIATKPSAPSVHPTERSSAAHAQILQSAFNRRLGRSRNLSPGRPNTNADGRKIARPRTRSATIEDVLKNNIITRNRRSMENVLSVTSRDLRVENELNELSTSKKSANTAPLRTRNTTAPVGITGTRIPRLTTSK